MAYINAEETKAKRDNLKKEFPASEGWKLSVKNENHSTISVAILEAPVRFADEDYKQLNHYNFKDYQNAEYLQRMYEIINEGNHDNSDPQTDYFDVGFYVSISQGEYNRPFVLVEVKKHAKPAPQNVEAGKIQVIEYSERAIAVIGDTYPIREKLKAAGGKFNKFLSCGAGWIFSKNQLDELKTLLESLKQTEPTGVQAPDETEESAPATTTQTNTPELNASAQTQSIQISLF